jgi:hypothetical protein
LRLPGRSSSRAQYGRHLAARQERGRLSDPCPTRFASRISGPRRRAWVAGLSSDDGPLRRRMRR